MPFVTTIFLFIFGSNWSGAIVPWKLLELPEGELAALGKSMQIVFPKTKGYTFDVDGGL